MRSKEQVQQAAVSRLEGRVQRTKTPWSLPHYLALVGVPFLIWQTWTIVAWLADGPFMFTKHNSPRNDVEWFAAKSLEAIAVIASVAVIVHLVRDCRRQGRLLTFDVMFCIAAGSMGWADIGTNFFQPTMLESTYFINVNNMCGHMPFVVNPDCGQVPDLILFWLIEAFCLLGMAMIGARLVAWARRRWSGISTAKLFGLVVAACALFDLVLEAGVAVPLHLWSYPGPDWMSIEYDGGGKFVLAELVAATAFFAAAVLLRIFRDDRGRTVLERRTEHHTPRVRTLITMMSLYAFMQIVVWATDAPLMLMGPYEAQWEQMPKHLLNDVCDAPGVTGTRYGPCPGSPGYRMPGRHSLPGESP